MGVDVLAEVSEVMDVAVVIGCGWKRDEKSLHSSVCVATPNDPKLSDSGPGARL